MTGEVVPTRYETANGGLVTSFCPRCGSGLLVELESWPQWVYPFASAIDTPLPKPAHFIHIHTAERPAWVPPHGFADDPQFSENTTESIEAWHERLGVAGEA